MKHIGFVFLALALGGSASARQGWTSLPIVDEWGEPTGDEVLASAFRRPERPVAWPYSGLQARLVIGCGEDVFLSFNEDVYLDTGFLGVANFTVRVDGGASQRVGGSERNDSKRQASLYLRDEHLRGSTFEILVPIAGHGSAQFKFDIQGVLWRRACR